MARTTKKQAEIPAVATRAEKKDATKNLIRELLAVKPYKHNELIEETAKLYTERFGGEETDNVNDVKGRVGSVLDIMKKESDVAYDGGMYALKARLPMPEPTPEPETKPVKNTAKTKAKKAEPAVEEKPAEATEEPVKKTARKGKAKAEEPKTEAEQKPVKKATRARAKKTEEPKAEEVKAEEIKEEKSAKKTTRGRAKKTEEKVEPKAEATEAKEEPKPVEKGKLVEEIKPIEEAKPEVKAEEKPEVKAEAKPEEKAEVKNPPIVKEKAEVAKKNVVMDMSFLFGGVKQPKAAPKTTAKAEEEKTAPVKAEEKAAPSPKTEEKPAPKTEQKPVAKAEQKPVPTPTPKAETKQEAKSENKPASKADAPKKEERRAPVKAKNVRKVENKPMTADERLCEAFLKRMRALGGDYFEYYSVYLLERYSMKNGRRLEGMRICGGDRDGGIDGEIELTDKFGFKETIYVQAKNWDPDKGDERLWVVGETLLQQFIGACACKQAKDGKQHSRGIFVTTSRFTPDAKRILETMSDKIIGYDGKDLFEAAKECEFGVIKRGNEWVLDEKLLSGTKAFFNMY